jgi:hypothetical protein
MEERLTAVLDGRTPLEGELESVADELGSLVDNALAAASGLERAEDAADALDRSLDDVGDEITKARVKRWIRTTHNKLQRQQRKQSTAGPG